MTLQVRDLVRHFGGVRALDGVSFDVAPGECVALIGPNGAGKSTCFACIAGQQPPLAGAITWEGQRLEGLSPAQRLKRGVARTFQVAQTFEALTVRQNVQLVASAHRGLPAWNRLDRVDRGGAEALLDRVGLLSLADADVQNLPYGAKKRLELAMALASRPRLLLLDEPAAGLAGPERARLMQLVQSLARQGLAVLYTEHNMDAVFGVADRVLVLIDGRLFAQGSAAEMAADPTVRDRYLGRAGGASAVAAIEGAR